MRIFHRRLIVLIGFCILATFSYTSSTAGTLTKSLTFDATDIHFNQLGEYDVVTLKDCELTYRVGEPQLPIYIVHLVLPSGTEVENVELTGIESQYLPNEYLIYPVQSPQILSAFQGKNQPIPFVEPKPSIYNSDTAYPQQIVRHVRTGHLGGYTIASFMVYPLQYIPAQKQLIFHSRVNFTVTYTRVNQFNLSAANLSPSTRAYYQETVKKLISNPEYIETACSTGMSSFKPIGEAYSYVIITDEAYVSLFQPLADWKTKKGVPAKIVTTSWIYANYLGLDNQTKIRTFIKYAFENWGTIWVLLGGDKDQVPIREAFAMDCEANIIPNENNIPCDLYYSDLNDSWEKNHNNIYGEVADKVDMYPDVFVGRASVDSPEEAQAFVNKILTYEKSPPEDYLLRMLFAAEILWKPPGYPYTDQGIAKDKIDNDYVPSRFDITKLYARDGNESRSTVLSAMNQGMNIINHDGHAWYTVMGVGQGSLGRGDMDELVNGPRYSILFSIGCYPAAFDYDCIAEHFLINPNGGGVAFIGNSRYGWGSPGNPGYGYSDRFDNRFYHVLFKDNIFNIGATLAWSKAFFVPFSQQENVYRWCMYEINLLGDPEMPIWTDTPGTLTVQHPLNVPVGQSSFQVTVTDDNTPVVDAMVCIMKDGEVYTYGRTDATGQINLIISPASPVGKLDVTVTAHNYLPYEGTADVISDAAYVASCGYIIDDSQGNGDGQLTPGESVNLNVWLKNYGNQNTQGIKAVLRAMGTGVTVTDSTANYGDINAGDSLLAVDTFSFSVGSNCTNGQIIYLNLTITSSSQDQWNCSLGLPVMTPVVVYKTLSIKDQDTGDGDGIPDPGETVDLLVYLENQGSALAQNVSSSLKSTDTYLLLPQKIGQFGDLAPAAMGVDSFRVVIDATCPTPRFPIISLDVSTEGGYNFRNSLMLTIGETGFFDDMESGEGGWTHIAYNDLWHLSSHRYHSSSKSWYCGIEGSWEYSKNNKSSLVSPWFYLGQEPILSFWAWYDVAIYGVNGFYVEINDGSGWKQFDFIGSGGALDPILMGNSWLEYTYDLSEYPPGTSVQLRFRFVSDYEDVAEGVYIDDVRVSSSQATDVNTRPQAEVTAPKAHALAQNYPNPFNQETVIRYQISDARFQKVSLKIFNVLGQEVRTLVEENQKGGNYIIHWDGKNNLGEMVSSGVYLYQLQVGSFQVVRKLVVLR